MIATNTNWDAANARLAKRPVYAMVIGGQATVYTTHDLARVGITGTLPDYRPWLKTPQGASQSIDVVNGTSTIGELTCEVVEQNDNVLTLVGGANLEGATLTLRVGYPGLAWSEFVTLQSYVLYKITPSADYTSWMFQARDRQIYAKKTISLHPENGAVLSDGNPWYVGGSPCEVAQAILLFGLELLPSLLDLAAFSALESANEGLYGAARPLFFALTEPFGAKSFLETEIWKPCGLYPVITADGLISVKSFRPPAAGPSISATFSADNVCGLPQIDRMPIINEAIIRSDYDGNGFQSERYFLESNSLGTFGRSDQWVVESKGLRSELGGRWFGQWAASRMFRRFAGIGLRGGAPTAKIDAFLMTLPVWVGDYVYLDHPKMPDVLTGARGVTNRIYEVIGRDPDYANGRMSYTLLDTGLTGSPPAHEWGAGSARPLVIGTGTWF